jgi:hypothetical protein
MIFKAKDGIIRRCIVKKTFALTLALMLAITPMAFANTGAFCEAADSDAYLKSTGGKLLRGVGNVAFCWTELFRRPAEADNKFVGIGEGIMYTIGRALSGAAEAVASPIPNINVPHVEPSCPTDLVVGS